MLRKYDHTIFSVCPRIFPTAQARQIRRRSHNAEPPNFCDLHSTPRHQAHHPRRRQHHRRRQGHQGDHDPELRHQALIFQLKNGIAHLGQCRSFMTTYAKQKDRRQTTTSLRGPSGRGNLLENSSGRYGLPGDCHVGLRPPRNDSPFLTRCCRTGHRPR